MMGSQDGNVTPTAGGDLVIELRVERGGDLVIELKPGHKAGGNDANDAT